MADNQFSELCEVYLLNNHRVHGLIPLVICPDKTVEEDMDRMKILNTHYVWRISLRDQRLLDYIDLAYKDKVFYARKFITLAKMEMQSEGLEHDEFITIVIIIVLPEELSIFGKDLLLKITSEIILNFEGKVFKIIDSRRTKEARASFAESFLALPGHSCGGRNPGILWIPAFAGMTERARGGPFGGGYQS